VKRPILGPDGVAHQVLGVATDISERKRVEQALAESQERYRRFLEQTPLALFVARPDGRLVECNPAYARLVGRAAGSCGEGLAIGCADPEAWAALVERARSEGCIERAELTLCRADGRTVRVAASLVARFEGAELRELQGCAVAAGEP
jgi:PAS domain S-box-containing protein